MDVDKLEQLAQQLVARVRDDDPESNRQWLLTQLPNPQDWFRLCFALAAAVPDDRSWVDLVAWHTGAPVEAIERRRAQWRASKQRGRSGPPQPDTADSSEMVA